MPRLPDLLFVARRVVCDPRGFEGAGASLRSEVAGMSRPGDSGTREGYLLLADISGYTAFLTGTELEHSYEIIRELTTLIRERLAPPMRFVKVEGDAVFCYTDAATFRHGQQPVDL